MPERAQILLKNKTPLQPIEAPKRRSVLLTTTDDDDEFHEASEVTSASQEAEDKELDDASTSSKPQQQNFKAQLEQLLSKPAARVISKPKMIQIQQARPVPLPRKRVMFNTEGSRRSTEDNSE